MVFGLSSLLLILLAVAMSFYQQNRSNESKNVADNTGLLQVGAEKEKAPKYVPGEVIVKFKNAVNIQTTQEATSRTPSQIGSREIDKRALNYQEIDQKTLPYSLTRRKYEIVKIEKVFKGTQEPAKELLKLKSKFKVEIDNGRRKIDEQDLKAYDFSQIYTVTYKKEVNISAVVSELSQDQAVEYAELNYIYSASYLPNDTAIVDQYALENDGRLTGSVVDADMDATSAWDVVKGDSYTIIAVIDTGIDYSMSEMGGGFGGNYKVISGYDYVNKDSDPMDDHGHGTHVAGIISAVTNNNQGMAGVCPDCKLLAVKFLDNSGQGPTDDAVKAIQFAVGNGARILNNSWGGEGYSQALQDVINWANSWDVVVIAAAGNANSPYPFMPAAMHNVISVAATDNADKKAIFSNYDNGTGWVDVSAPGNNILTLVPIGKALPLSCKDSWYGTSSDGLTLCSGTSMASPQVAGLAGLILSQHPEWQSIDVSRQIKYTTDNIDAINPSYAGKMGKGRVNANNAVTQIVTPEPDINFSSARIEDNEGIWKNGLLEPGEKVSFYVTLRNDWITTDVIGARLTSNSQYVTINDKDSSFGTVPMGEEKENTLPFKFTVSPTAPKYSGSRLAYLC